MGFSRDTFYRYKAAVDEGGVSALFEKSRNTPNLKNRVDQMTEDAVIAHAIEYPAHGQLRASNELDPFPKSGEHFLRLGDLHFELHWTDIS